MDERLHTIATAACLVLGLVYVSAGAIMAAFPALGGNAEPLTQTGGAFLLASGLIQWQKKAA